MTVQVNGISFKNKEFTVTYKRNAYMRYVRLTRSNYTNFGEPNTHYSCDVAGTGFHIQLKAASTRNIGDRFMFTVHRNNANFGALTSAANDIPGSGGNYTNSSKRAFEPLLVRLKAYKVQRKPTNRQLRSKLWNRVVALYRT